MSTSAANTHQQTVIVLSDTRSPDWAARKAAEMHAARAVKIDAASKQRADRRAARAEKRRAAGADTAADAD